MRKIKDVDVIIHKNKYFQNSSELRQNKRRAQAVGFSAHQLLHLPKQDLVHNDWY